MPPLTLPNADSTNAPQDYILVIELDFSLMERARPDDLIFFENQEPRFWLAVEFFCFLFQEILLP